MMSESIKEIKDFARVEVEGLHKELNFYYGTEVCLPQIVKGISFGKKLAYDKILSLIDKIEYSQKEEK